MSFASYQSTLLSVPALKRTLETSEQAMIEWPRLPYNANRVTHLYKMVKMPSMIHDYKKK